MRRTFFRALRMFAAIVLAASCNKIENDIVSVERNGRSLINGVAQSICGGTRAYNEYSYIVKWNANDQIWVTDNEGRNNTFTLNSGKDTPVGTFSEDEMEGSTYAGFIPGKTVEAFYPACLHAQSGGYKWPAVQTNNQVAPMYAKQAISGTGAETVSFSSLGAMLQIVFNTTVPNIVLKSIELKDGTKPLSGEFKVDSEGKAVITSGDAAITLDLGEDGKILGKGANYFYIAVPAGKYENLTLTFTGTDDGYFLMTGGNLDIQRNTVGRLTLTGSKYHPAILPGVFTVSAGVDGVAGTDDDVKVRFSPGNLRYNVENEIWSFFRNQYDCGPATYSAGHDKEISLFTWGYGGWSTGPDTEEYLSSVVGGADFGPTQDWGSRLGDGTLWRTLTKEETEYLFSVDSTRGRAVVCGVNGHIIVPNTFVDPLTNMGSSPFVPVTESEVNSTWKDNIYPSESDWDAMESAGAVFFPAAGYREKDSIESYGDICEFWTTTTSSYIDRYAYRMYMTYAKGVAPVGGDKNCGFPVRLVTDVK